MSFPASTKQLTLAEFTHQIEQEFISGSEIAPALYATATRIVSDTEQQFGEARYPIHEALNWRLTRFGQSARSTMNAVLLQQESGETWQAKLSTPRVDQKRLRKRHHSLSEVRDPGWQWLAGIFAAHSTGYSTEDRPTVQLGNFRRRILLAMGRSPSRN
ncbi:MAG: hypothetical protein HC780_14870 [Leptolyngbyaceae cyanobacterium CSU_1_3]|nr:hypothetical protein [Leptolyngbyaceae cyanobacterium CSU_1_3]